MVKDMSAYIDDADRIAETIFQLDYKGQIKNADDFNKFFDEYLGNNGVELRQSNQFRDMTFESFVENHPERITEPEDFKERKKPVVKEQKIKREFNILGKVGKQIVFLRKDFIEVNGKKRVQYKDRRGRIGKPKNKPL